MWQQILPGLRIKIFLTVLLGIVYPLAMTGISKALFPRQSAGSLITENGKVLGSELIGQSFTRPEYFNSRPSNAGMNGYDATASSGYNQGPTNKKLVARIGGAVEQFRKDNPDYTGPIPADLVTGSASGLAVAEDTPHAGIHPSNRQCDPQRSRGPLAGGRIDAPAIH